jgi:predicted MFS family arabinose efflux permease
VHTPIDGGTPCSAKGRALPSSGGRAPSPASLRGLDWFVFFLADVQTGFGPFVTVYLTAQAWTQTDIGLALTVGGLVALAGQMPGGAIVDAARSVRFVAAVSVGAIAASALALALAPVFPVVVLSQIVHAGASCVLGPALAAISLGLVGHGVVGERFGRNARFAAIGNGLAAGAMGACGYFISDRYVFVCTAILVAPTLWALSRIRPEEIDPEGAHGGPHPEGIKQLVAGLAKLAADRRLLLLAGCVLLFHLANAAMLPLMAGVVTTRSAHWATVLVAACIIVPQIAVALFSPWVGRQAQAWGRRPILLAGFAALCVRGVLFAVVANPYLLVAVQILDGVAAAALGVMVPLIVADVTRGTGRFNLAQGFVGSAVGIGASASTTLAGYFSDHFGSSVAFFGLAAIAAGGLALAFAALPETRPKTVE